MEQENSRNQFATRALEVLVFAAILALLSCSPWIIENTIARTPGCIVDVAGADSRLALTIDDGPNPETTAKILDELAENGAHATFFLISGNVEGNEGVVRRLVAEGNEIGNHLTANERSISLPPEEFESAVVTAGGILSRYDKVVWIRPGGGRYNERMVETWGARGYRCALGAVYPFDTVISWTWLLETVVARKARAGSIIILHDGPGRGDRTAAILSRLLPRLAERGFEIVTLSDLVASSRNRGLEGPLSLSPRDGRLEPIGPFYPETMPNSLQ